MTFCAILYGTSVGHAGLELKGPGEYERKLHANGHTDARVVELNECTVCSEMHLPPFDGSCLLG